MKKRYRIRIVSGNAKGRFVGARLANPNGRNDSSINVPGSEYGLHKREATATEFFEGAAKETQIELLLLGYESELVLVSRPASASLSSRSARAFKSSR
jgi:hypothetical protein